MANFQEKIAKLFPDATFAQDGTDIMQITIDDAHWHDLARTLRDDADLSMDYLITIVGMDWVDSLGCIYYFASTKTRRLLSVRVAAADRDKPMIHSVADLYLIDRKSVV